jgi:16S rRNA (cytosine967-C5)-methyltransferase
MPDHIARQGLEARAAALALLGRVLQDGVALDEALAADRGLDRLSVRDRAFARALVAATLRRLGQIDAVLAGFIDRPLPEKAHAARNVLRLGAAQLFVLEAPPHAVVDTAVRLAEANGAERMKGLVNAVLRRCDREGRAAFAAADAARLNTPDWLWQSWEDAYGEDACRRIAAAHLDEPPLDLSVKADDVARWAAALDAEALPGGTLRLRRAGMVTALPGFEEGAWWVQDAAAALPARVLLSALGGRSRGRAAIDLCAAPGGKTAQLAAAGARVVAVDRSEARLATLRRNLDRLKLTAETVAADAAAWRPAAPADAVLLDAPCTATGTIRRHPDIPWLKRAGSAAAVTKAQDALLRAAASMVKPGGVLVYSVCSLQPEEGAARIDALLAGLDGFAREPIAAGEAGAPEEAVTEAGDLRTLPCHMAAQGGMDGFYIARLRRTA